LVCTTGDKLNSKRNVFALAEKSNPNAQESQRDSSLIATGETGGQQRSQTWNPEGVPQEGNEILFKKDD